MSGELHASTQLLFNDDAVLWDAEAARSRTEANARKWAAVFEEAPEPDPDPPASQEELTEVGRAFAQSISRRWPRIAAPGPLRIRMTDLRKDAAVDLRSGRFDIVEPTSDSDVVVDIDAASLLFLIKFPWGADTVHISSCFYVRDAFLWKWFTYVRHLEYKFPDGPAVYRFAPLALAFMRARLGISWHDE
jgi:hypothetical protein